MAFNSVPRGCKENLEVKAAVFLNLPSWGCTNDAANQNKLDPTLAG